MNNVLLGGQGSGFKPSPSEVWAQASPAWVKGSCCIRVIASPLPLSLRDASYPWAAEMVRLLWPELRNIGSSQLTSGTPAGPGWELCAKLAARGISGLAQAKSSRKIKLFCRSDCVHPRVGQGSDGGEGSEQGEAGAPLGLRMSPSCLRHPGSHSEPMTWGKSLCFSMTQVPMKWDLHFPASEE